MKITPCDNTADEVPIKNNNNKKDQNLTSLIKKKECAKGRLVVFLVKYQGCASYSTLLALLGDYAWKSYAGLT